MRASLLFILALIAGACSHATPQSTPVFSPTGPVQAAATRSAPSSAASETGTPYTIQSPAGVQPTFTPGPPEPTRTRPPTRATQPGTARPDEAACLQAGGKIVTRSLQTDLVRLPLQFRVYLPPCYTPDPDRPYPVLYLFHGQSYTDDQWDRMGADETAGRLIAAGEVAPFLIVMPYERYGGQPTDHKFHEAFIDQLIPYIEKTYAVRTDRKGRAIGGLSRGAGWSVHFGFSEWRMFGAVGAHSPAVFHADAPKLRTWLNAIPEENYPRVYIDIGDKDRPEITRATLWFEAIMDEYDLPHEWHLFSGYHAEEYWSEHMEGYLRWYARDW